MKQVVPASPLCSRRPNSYEPMAAHPGNEKSPLPLFFKGGSKDDGFKSPFVRGGFERSVSR